MSNATPPPQPGILATDSRSQWVGEFRVADSTSVGTLRAALRGWLEAVSTHTVIAFGPDLLPQLTREVPDDHMPLLARTGRTGRSMPAEPADLFVWLHGPSHDVVMTDVLALRRAVGSLVELHDETFGFTYLASRDLSGFEDGTANPSPEEVPAVAFVPAGRPGAGGSHVIVQKWEHHLEALLALDVAEQEAIIGRTKADSVELEEIPPDSHLGRVVIEEDGDELEMFRRSFPWGAYSHHGLYFLGFSADPSTFERMLDRMFAVDEPVHDRLTDWSTALTGARYFAPAASTLSEMLRD